MNFFRFLSAWTPALRCALMTLVLVLAAGVGVTFYSENERYHALRRGASDVALAQAYVLERQVQRSLLSTYALAAIVRRSREPDDPISDFESLAADMIRSYGGIQALEIAPRGVIAQVHPLRGNEAAIGLDLLRDPRRREGALAAQKSGHLSLIGPFPLVQGNVGALGLLPVFRAPQRQNPSSGRFQGFVLAVINMNDLLKSTNITQMARQGYSWELGRIAPRPNTSRPDTSHLDEPQIFARSGTSALETPVAIPIRVPNAEWVLRVSPQGGWQRGPSLRSKLLLLLGLAAASAWGAGAYAAQLARRHTAEEDYRHIFENAVEGIYRTAADGRYLNVNPAMAALFGYNTPRHLMAQVKRFGDHAWMEAVRYDELARQLEARGTVEGWEMEVRRHGGGEIWVSINARSVETAGGFEGTITDITEHKRAQALRQTLTDMIVHDLRTPLTSLSFTLGTMKLMGDLTQMHHRCLDVAQQGARISLEMIADLLDISRMEATAHLVDASTFEPHLLLSEALSRIEPLAAHEGISLKLKSEALPPLLGDRDKLLRVLVNLLDNAVKFSPQGGTITLSGHLDKLQGALIFAVADQGEGIAPESQIKIFEKFGQTVTHSKRRSNGLGLAFCKMVAEAHGGKITVQSEIGRGSTFTFSVPY